MLNYSCWLWPAISHLKCPLFKRSEGIWLWCCMTVSSSSWNNARPCWRRAGSTARPARALSTACGSWDTTAPGTRWWRWKHCSGGYIWIMSQKDMIVIDYVTKTLTVKMWWKSNLRSLCCKECLDKFSTKLSVILETHGVSLSVRPLLFCLSAAEHIWCVNGASVPPFQEMIETTQKSVKMKLQNFVKEWVEVIGLSRPFLDRWDWMRESMWQ